MKKVMVLLVCVAMTLVLLGGCSSSTPDGKSDTASTPGQNTGASSPSGASGETVKFGLIAPITGTNAEFGQTYQAAVAMAVKEINNNGGVNGRNLEYVEYDSAGDASKSVDVCRKLIDDPEVVAILGDYSSSCCMANAPLVAEAGIMMCSGGASNPAYCVMNDYCFSINGREDVEAPYMCQYVIGKYLDTKKLAIFWVNNDYGAGSEQIFAEEAAKNGIEVVASESYIDGESDFSSLIAKARAADPDTLLILDSSTSVAQIINQIAQAGWKIPTVNLGAGVSTQIVDLAAGNAEGLVTTAPFFFDESDDGMMAWLQDFEARTGFTPEFQGPVMRDLVYMLKQAIEDCGDDITRQNVRDNFAKQQFDGYTGHIQFESDGSVARAYYIAQVEDGKWVQKAGLDYANE